MAKRGRVEMQWDRWGEEEEAGYHGDYTKSNGHMAVSPLDPLIPGGVQDADPGLTHLSTVMPRPGWEHCAHTALH